MRRYSISKYFIERKIITKYFSFFFFFEKVLGAGEILLNCIDKDGTNSGFDIDLIREVKNSVKIPVIGIFNYFILFYFIFGLNSFKWCWKS